MVEVNYSENKRIARNTAFLYVRLIIVLFISLYTTRLVLKALGVVDYGIYEAVGGIVTIFSVFNSTLSNGINRYINVEKGKGEKGRLNQVFTNSVIVQAGLVAIIVLLVETIGLWYINSKLVLPNDRIVAANWVLQLSALSFVFMIMQVPYSAIIISYERMDFYSIVSIICSVAKLVGVFSLALYGGDALVMYGAVMAIVSMVHFLLYYVYIRTQFKHIRMCKSVDKPLLKEMTSFAGWNILDPLAYTFRGQGSNIVLNYFFGPILNAAWGLSNQVAVAIDQFAVQIGLAFRPQLIQSCAAGNEKRSLSLMYAMSKFSFALQMMLCVPLIINLPIVLNLWIGETNIPDYTIEFTAFILAVKTINTLNSPISTLVLAIGKIKKLMVTTSLIVSSILPLSIMSFSLGFTPVSLYVIMLFLTILNQCASVIILARLAPYFHVVAYIKEVVFPVFVLLLLTLIPTIIIASLISNLFIRLLVTSMSSLIFTSVFAYSFVLNKHQKEMLVEYVKSKIR